MSKRIIALATGILIAIMVFSTAFAGGGIKVSGVSFTLGSLIANGTVSGIGNTDVTMVLVASGIPAITCINNGTNSVPGQSSPKVTAQGTEALPGNDPLRKNGKSSFGVETNPPDLSSWTWQTAGCPNSNWTFELTFVYWTNATIYVYDTATQSLLTKQNYACTTTLTSVSCVPTN
jgi:hypothetical protein